MKGEVEFYFDFISVYAYFAWKRIGSVCGPRGVVVKPRPVLFAGLLNHWGQLGPAEIGPKRTYVFKSCLRYAHHHGIPLVGPATHPFHPVAALRLAMMEVCGGDQDKVISALFDAGWGRGIDLGDKAALVGALDEAGLEGGALLAATEAPEVKAGLRANTAEAIARGVFGVPAIFAGDELFWGNDSLEDLGHWLDGEDPITDAHVEAFLSKPRGADRPSTGKKG